MCTRAASTDWNQCTRLQSETIALKGSPLLALAAVTLHVCHFGSELGLCSGKVQSAIPAEVASSSAC